MKSADNQTLRVNQAVFIRVGGEYPVPGRWRCRSMVIERFKRTGRVVMRPVSGKTKSEREPDQVFVNKDVAQGKSA